MKNCEIEDKFLWDTLMKCSKDIGEFPEYLLRIVYSELVGTSWSYNQIYRILDSLHGQY